MGRISVIVPAAGAGKRFGAKENKIFQDLRGRPVFLRTLDLFARRDDVCQVQLVTADDDIKTIEKRFGDELKAMNVAIIAGGTTRAMSVRNALANVSDEAELVCVHDAVRPCVTKTSIDAIFDEASKTGAAILACPMHGTLKSVGDDGKIVETISRAGVWQAQTPQVFRKDILLLAYSGDLSGVTDDAQLVEATGVSVKVVPGDPRNIKITAPGDLALAGGIIDSLTK